MSQTSCCKQSLKMSLLGFFLISVKQKIFSFYSHTLCLYLAKKCSDKLFLVSWGMNINICTFVKYHLCVRIIPSVINWKIFFLNKHCDSNTRKILKVNTRYFIFSSYNKLFIYALTRVFLKKEEENISWSAGCIGWTCP